MKKPSWFRPRGYKHLDAPVSIAWANRITPALLANHSWSPLLHWVKKSLRYKVDLKKTVVKDRNIMFASHRDACILAKYSADLVVRLDALYEKENLGDNIIAYRSLGKSNYHFAATAQEFVRSHDIIEAMCFDVTGFFDHINHKKLKSRLRALLGTLELPDDWFRVFRFVTKFSCVRKADLAAHPHFADRVKAKGAMPPIGTIGELKAQGVRSIRIQTTTAFLKARQLVPAFLTSIFSVSISS